MPKYTVKQGECIASIAEKYGLLPDTIWNDPANVELKTLRKDLNVLHPGDVVEVRKKKMKEETIATGQRHTFRRKGASGTLHIRLLDEFDEPRANLSYALEIDGDLRQGTTDGDGVLEEMIPAGARKGKLIIGEEEEIELNLGHLDPITETSGAQARLANLGFDCGPADGVLGPRTQEAIEQFQYQHDLEITGELDDDTINKLEEIHGR